MGYPAPSSAKLGTAFDPSLVLVHVFGVGSHSREQRQGREWSGPSFLLAGFGFGDRDCRPRRLVCLPCAVRSGPCMGGRKGSGGGV